MVEIIPILLSHVKINVLFDTQNIMLLYHGRTQKTKQDEKEFASL